MSKNNCFVCSANVTDGCFTEVTITTYIPSGMSLQGSVREVKLCNRPECLVKYLESERNMAEQKVKKTKTNKVGPAAPGFPGSAFNGD